MAGKSDKTSKRKSEHLDHFRHSEEKSENWSAWWEHVRLIHSALPEMALSEIDIQTDFLDHHLDAPLMITGMTGGTPEARQINRDLASLAQEFGIAFGVGSQRAMLEDPGLVGTYQVRDVAPDIPIVANIGGVQAKSLSKETAEDMVHAIGANALAVHLNPAQELAQAEGDSDFRGVIGAIKQLASELPFPLIVKETGSGINKEIAQHLRDAGVTYVDVAGAGGTDWIAVEKRRSGKEPGSYPWAIPTAASLLECKQSDLYLIASGGIRSGEDAARAIALGANLVGVAAPIIRCYLKGGINDAKKWLAEFVDSFRNSLLLTGNRSIPILAKSSFVLTGPLADWANQRGLIQ